MSADKETAAPEGKLNRRLVTPARKLPGMSAARVEASYRALAAVGISRDGASRCTVWVEGAACGAAADPPCPSENLPFPVVSVSVQGGSGVERLWFIPACQ